jgi:hypothetical protein
VSQESDVRWSLRLILVALGALPATLTAQSASPPVPTKSETRPVYKPRPHAIGFGFVATLGANWQMEGVEVAYVRRMERGLAALSVSTRVATFINESTMLGGSQGIAFGGTLAARTRMKSFAQFGEEEHGSAIGADLTLEVTGYTTSGSPLSRTQWLAISLLPALSLGSGDSPHFGIVIGPTLFLGDGKPAARGLLAFRGEAPLARRERVP